MSKIREQQSMKFSESIGATQPSHSQKSGRMNRTPSDIISYEDLLIAHYLEELRKQPPPLAKKKPDERSSLTRGKQQKLSSPYLQKLPHSSLFLLQQSSSKSKRPVSATQSARLASREKQRIDPKFIADANKWEPDNQRSDEEKQGENDKKKRERPSSAPARTKTHMRPTSAKSTTSTVSRISMRSSYSTSGRRNRPFYRTPTTIKCTAYKNGHKDIFAEISAPNIKILLEQCTVKLGLTTAARKVFLSNGKEALLPSDIERGDDIYISCGEPFKDPTTCEKSNIEMKKSASWTVNGVVFAEERKKRKTKPALSKRLRSMLAQKNRRVMVFKNGDGQEMTEVVVSMDKFASFLDDCTSRLNLTTPARAAYTWHGVAITDLHDAPKLDKCLQTSTTPVIGPLWISKGEGFSPSGTKDFLKAVITHCKQKIKGLEQYKEQLEYAQDGEKDKVTVSKIQSMDDDDIYEEMKETDGHISTFKAALKKLREVNRNINIMVSEEEAAGHEYILGHIKEISSSDRLVGTPGIKIKVFQNGKPEREEVIYVNMKELSKGVNSGQKLGDSGKDPIDAKTFIMQRLLDQIGNRYGGACKPRRLFTKDSVEIKDVSELEHEQEVCFTLGENYKSSQVFVLQLQLDKVRGFNLFGERNAIMKEPLQADDYGAGREKHSQWEACIGFPLIYEFEDINMNMDQSSREHIMSNLKLQELDTKSHFMQLKDNLNLVLYPDVIVSDKKKWNDKGMWPPHGQTWVISKSGMISCKAMPSMSLTATEYKIDATLPDKTTELHGFAVAMQKKMLENPAQQWGFSPEGFIYSLAQPSLVLTFIGDLSMESDPICVGDSDRQYTGQTCAIAVVEKFAAKHSEARRQRFAIKQEILHKMGQWKHSKVDNPLWNKLAYSWPVTEDGTWNEEFDWPMEGYFVTHAPPLRKPSSKNAPNGVLPIRLRVLKNGERDFKRAALVVGPDLTNMMKDLNRTAMNGKRPLEKKKTNSDVDENTIETKESEKNLDLQKLEIQLFLDRCTSLLNLPFAARRIFDLEGNEQHTLHELQRDQLVYVSCGEIWTDPKLSKSEQQRRFLLANLTADVQQMTQYCTIRNPTNLVMEVDGPIQSGSRVIVNMCCMTKDERKAMEKESEEEPSQQDEPPEDPLGGLSETDQYSTHVSLASAHARAHVKSEERYENKKLPWERNSMNAGIDEVKDANDADGAQFTNPELYKKFQARPKSPSKRVSLQRFVYQDGFIAVESRPDLVLGSEDGELIECSEVVLCKKRIDDVNQRWVFSKSGLIHGKSNYDVVLGVAMPYYKHGDGSLPSTFEGQPVTLQCRKSAKLGSANYKWTFDHHIGFIDAFACEDIDKEVTAANKSNVCTFAVLGHKSAEQPGYTVCLSNRDSDPTIVCVACARAMRGYQKLEKLERQVEFSCAVGTAKERGIRNLRGCFQCLNGKVDLSTYEAENTLRHWQEELIRLRTVSNARTIAKELSAYQPILSVRILAFKNGEGRTQPPELIVGSSITGLLDQCTYRLGLNSAARRLYTEDGKLILSKDDLIQWAMDCQSVASNKKPTEADVETQNSQGVKPNREHRNARPSSGSLQRRGSFGSASDLRTEINLHALLRQPIEVWVSSGEPFVKPKTVDKLRAVSSQHREERTGVSVELDKEKHVLRQMQGRRTHSMTYPELIPTMDTENPVSVEGGWSQPSYQENKKAAQVQMLENHLHEMKEHQRKVDPNVTRASDDYVTQNLYKQSNMKRVYVYVNGGNAERALYAWGENIQELLDSATERMTLRLPAKKLYSRDGLLIQHFDDIEKDQLLAVSCGEPFKDTRGNKQDIERKAEWGRIRKKDGPHATDIIISTNKNTSVEVDPFGPPVLALESNGIEKEPPLFSRTPQPDFHY